MAPFTKDVFDKMPKTLLRDGRWGNARVYLVEADNKKWTVKDFSSRHWFVKNFFARFILKREKLAIDRLKGVEGVPQEAFFIGDMTLAITYMPGSSMIKAPKDKITVEFLEGCENIIKSLHKRDLVHLDTGGEGNWVVSPNGKPALIDFQSSLKTSGLPKFLKRFAEDMDMSGVYKKWLTYHPDKMGEYRQSESKRINKLRKFWIFRGYLGIKKSSKKSNQTKH